MRALIVLALSFLLLGCTSQEQTYTPLSDFPEDTLEGAELPSDDVVTAPDDGFTLHVLYFYGGTCQYSARATPTVNALESDYAGRNVKFHYYEVWYDAKNKALYDELAGVYGIREDNRGVPIIFIDGEYLLGYQRINQYLEQEIEVCLEVQCPNPLDALTNASIAVPI